MFSSFEEGFATDVEMFGDRSHASDLDLYTGLEELTDEVYRLLKVQLDKFAASKVISVISYQLSVPLAEARGLT